jgi:hypothetical protein
MARYAVALTDAAVTTGFITAGKIERGASKRFKIYDFMLSADGTPADNVLTWQIRQATTAGTAGAAVVAQPLDAADGAAVTTADEDFTIEPTLTGTPVFELSLNQRASYRWVAAPGGEIVQADTASEGQAFLVKSPGYTGGVTLTAHFEE